MRALLTAIQIKFTGDSSVTTAFPGGIHAGLAPEGTAMPYVVSFVASTDLQSAYGGTKFKEATVRFVAYGGGLDAMLTAVDVLTTSFDDATLSLSSGVNVDARRTDEPQPVLLRPRDGAGNEVWQIPITYTYLVR